MKTTPQIDDAPGLTWRLHKRGWEARWRARQDLVKRGYEPKNARLWFGWEPSAVEKDYIRDRCTRQQDAMIVWARGGLPVITSFDGTLKSLIHCYQHDQDSPFRKLRYHSKQNYESFLRRIEKDHGDERMADIKARLVKRWHENWCEGGKIPMAHGLIGMLRTLVHFGVTFLEDGECERLSGVLHHMKFEMGKPRNERLTAEQVIAIRKVAHEKGLHSIALAQAFQFELMLRQKDVIGEWVPFNEPGMSLVVDGNAKWLRGIRWKEIDHRLVLKHTTSKRQKDIEVDLNGAPMVMEELRRFVELPKDGPLIVYELTGRPYSSFQFRSVWRQVADAAGVPKSVKNMDSRAGAISEATDAGAELEHVRHAATHSDIGMTQRYSRGSIEKTANVMQARVAHRNKSRTA